MRQIILDIETTGLEAQKGDRIIEIGCIEMINRDKTDRHFHQYLNPCREIGDEAFAIHGISNEFLEDKPEFADIAQELIDFIRGGELIIHNAPFDVGFLNAELKRLGEDWGKIEDYCAIIDTLLMAREERPGQKNSLDALCDHYDVDNAQRDSHGALLDARILSDVYLAMTSGQETLLLELPQAESVALSGRDTDRSEWIEVANYPSPVIEPTAEEEQAHQDFLARIKRENGRCLWPVPD